MPRRQFVADLEKAQKDLLPLGVQQLQPGDDDGQFTFTFVVGPSRPIHITTMIPDVSEYPKSHVYILYCDESTPRNVAAVVATVANINRKTVFECIEIVAATLSNKLSRDQDGDTQMPDSQIDDEEIEVDEDEDDIYGSDHEAFDIDTNQIASHAQYPSSTRLKISARKFRARLRSDLIAAKSAGFKIGCLGALLDGLNAFVTLSIRMSKLGISDEAMQAWQVEPSDYLILIVQYPNGYKTYEDLQGIENVRLPSNLAIRVGASKQYKPTLQDAIRAFAVAKKYDCPRPRALDRTTEDDFNENSFKEIFISKPLVALLEKRLVPILCYRSAGMDWAGAESYYSDTSAATATSKHLDAVPDQYFQDEVINAAHPHIINADHHRDDKASTYSFPLLAMQFTLRHFVRCTEFCLVCHCKLSTELEAIKPYVCDKPLCLYQYMALGFGPSIEHEITAQPYVVDLLVSFCYSSAFARKLKDYPDGLSLSVPPVTPPGSADYALMDNNTAIPPPKTATTDIPSYQVGYDHDRLEIIFFQRPEKCPVGAGSWIVLETGGTLQDHELHCRVSETTYFPTIKIDAPIVLQPPQQIVGDRRTPLPQSGTNSDVAASPATSRTPITPVATPKWAPAAFQVYDQNFDTLDKVEKSLAICKLLDTLPTVKEIQDYMKRRPADLKQWRERISPAALSVLRWIIASNRACIMQVDGDGDKANIAGADTSTVFGKSQERLSGMKDFMQFRFAMGAPDKEMRFTSEVRKTAERLQLSYQTIFAWHGSPLHNWHMIIREGLHYKNVDHGRAYGHGVYHAIDARTSTGYSMMAGYGYGGIPNAPNPGQWSKSLLRINSALALNEIVNAPAEFTSSKPFYVVQHLDWIQTRYLFVQCMPAIDTIQLGSDVAPKQIHPQDPTRTPQGVSGSVVIPAGAIRLSRSAKRENTPPSNPSPLKRFKTALMGSLDNPIAIDEDALSDVTDPEDLQILFHDDPEPEPEPQVAIQEAEPLSRPKNPQGPTTDFVPGGLDFGKLPLMPQPSYAISSTTRRLMKELQSLHKVQQSSNLAELGWAIETEKIDNPYQWIVELHSFHTINPKLPLVADMKAQKIASIVLEVLFNKDFPFTPPYVRVVRPRFLTLAQGGGGHIVMGGAMCMELLTNTGWSSVSSMESVLMQIRLAVASDPPAKLDVRAKGDYGTSEAAEGYIRACTAHGWVVPPGFKNMAYGGKESGSEGQR